MTLNHALDLAHSRNGDAPRKKRPRKPQGSGTRTRYTRSDVLSRDAAFKLVHGLAGYEIGLRGGYGC